MRMRSFRSQSIPVTNCISDPCVKFITWHRTCVPRLLAAAVLLLPLFLASAAEDASEEEIREKWMNAYVQLEKAEKAEKEGALTEARQRYDQVREAFQKLHRSHPRWNPSLITYRIAYCAKRIRHIDKHLADRSANLSRDELSQLAAERKKRLQTALRDKDALTRRVKNLSSELDKTRLEAARFRRAQQEIDNLLEEKARWAAIADEARTRVEQLSGEVQRLRRHQGTNETVDALTEKLQRTNLQLAAARRDIVTLREKEAALNSKLQARTRRNQTLSQRIGALERMLAQRKETLNKNSRDIRQLLDQYADGVENSGKTPKNLARQTATLSKLLQSLQERNRTLNQTVDRLSRRSRREAGNLEEQLEQMKREKQKAQNEVGRLQRMVTRQRELLQKQEAVLAASSDSTDAKRGSASNTVSSDIRRPIGSPVNDEGFEAAGTDHKSLIEKQLQQARQRYEEEHERVLALEEALANAALGEPAADPDGADDGGAAAMERKTRARERQLYLKQLFLSACRAEEKGQLEQACRVYRAVLERDPDHEMALQRLGLIAAEQGRDDNAEVYLKRAFRANPDNVTTLANLGFTYLRQQKIDHALGMLSRAAALSAEDAGIHRALGVTCSSLGWTDAAEVQFRRALELDQKDAEAAYNLALLLATQTPRRMDEARRWYHCARRLGTKADPELDRVFDFPN